MHATITLDGIRRSENLRLFLDYDGTLADFAPTPDEVYPDQQLIDLLKKMIDHPGIQPAVISGRRLAHIRRLIPLQGILLAGTYGVEILEPSGKQIHLVSFESIRPTLEDLKPRWLELVRTHPDIYLEDKGWSLALHAKNMDGERSEKILEQARKYTMMEDFPTDLFRVMGGHKFLEVAPRLANKGSTVRYLLNRFPLNGYLPIYIGDDDKDEEAFAVIIENFGVAIKVGPQFEVSIAQLRLESPQTVREFLTSLL
jgi:trehalose 6-phosphate phosphatase